MQAMYTTGLKPSFLLWDKVYRKATAPEDEIWFAHALEAIIAVDEEKFAKDAALRYVLPSANARAFVDGSSGVCWPLAFCRSGFAHALLHLATESSSFEVRKAALDIVRKINVRAPKLIHLVMRDGIRSWLLQVSVFSLKYLAQYV
jgi:hypothetical protein